MAINTTWSVNNMTHVDADGGVILAYWSLVAASDAGGGETQLKAVKTVLPTMRLSSDYIAYASLKKAMCWAGSGKPTKKATKPLTSTRLALNLSALQRFKVRLIVKQHKLQECLGNE
jgi:ATP/maltotriose-dependent transcriptional regulator MalT